MTQVKPRGVCTVVYTSSDHEAAKVWFSELLGVAPYFDRPGYAEFRIGDYQQELGLMDGKFAGYLGGEVVPADGRAGAIVYWHVDDVTGMVERAVALGARVHHPVRQFQPDSDFVGGTVIDPFGNVLGFMHNPHYLKVLGRREGVSS